MITLMKKNFTWILQDRDWLPVLQSGEDSQNDAALGLAVKTKERTKKPSMYKVLMLNDDYTPMEFVIYVLESFFNKSTDEATRIMLHVHQRGIGLCGVFTYEVAETKVSQTMDLARKHDHPLQCTIEKDGIGEED
ncbi:MAG: ATP-dependent Clp protease adapter ClpS [Magnetovibrio sp.]|nr:ATP-dependent Clp protease adapter ClpS [Magnetovibrio sp.]|tara:strand:- start:388 stop:792 length:405 start_codon:yes stop_codon:yes gene_type:complete